MSTKAIVDDVKNRLKAGGFDGLYADGACGCCLDDLCPCGEYKTEEGEPWPNGCEAGFKHNDPRDLDMGSWVISHSKTPPTQAEFDTVFARC